MENLVDELIEENEEKQENSTEVDSTGPVSPAEETTASTSMESEPLRNDSIETGQNQAPKLPSAAIEESERIQTSEKPPSGMFLLRFLNMTELVMERFSKLLLGEDMSGGGKGVSSALALSNAITNLAASVFGEQRRLEPMAPERKARWRREMAWLLSVTNHIVEFAPVKQTSKDGTSMEIMTTRQRSDLRTDIPALRKLDTMLLDCLDNFKDQNAFTYVSEDEESETRKDDKWWIPTPKVPPNGLSDATKRWLQVQKDSMNQVLKAAMAINAQVLSEMAIPENYIDSLPKNGRSSLGELAYRSITVDNDFDPNRFLSEMDLSSEHKILDLKDRLEASIVIWRRKMHSKERENKYSAWGSSVSLEKRELFEERANTVLLILKHRFPGIPQSQLDISKIQYNRDVGHAILESYSRTLESLAFTVLSRIGDVLKADEIVRNPPVEEQEEPPLPDSSMVMGEENDCPDAKEEAEKINSGGTPTSIKITDFFNWTLGRGECEKKKDSSADSTIRGTESFGDDSLCRGDSVRESKPKFILVTKDGKERMKTSSFTENLENNGILRSPSPLHH
ncbi:hypothetical protein NMG60_11002583 [Bertholletia excelsa]